MAGCVTVTHLHIIITFMYKVLAGTVEPHSQLKTSKPQGQGKVN